MYATTKSSRSATAAVVVLVLLSCAASGRAAAAANAAATLPGGSADKSAAANQDATTALVANAVAQRDKDGATGRQKRGAFAALFKAAGLSTSAPKPPPRAQKPDSGSSSSSTEGSPAGSPDGGDGAAFTPEPVPHSPGWWYARPVNAAALREVAKSLQMGRGVDANHRLSLALFKRAADLGDPEAHGQMGLRYATGLAGPESVEGGAIKHFDAPDERRALLHYYFGAAAGDPLSALALGYRHAHGAGVPKSCWAAAAYYKGVAERVVDEALADGGVPQVERVRLNLNANSGLMSERNREMLQYYQHSADNGNVNAQSTVGKVLNAGSFGVTRDSKAAYHYLKRAADQGDSDAMAHIGHMYATGLVTGAPDYPEAARWFTTSTLKKQKKVSAAGLYGLGYLQLSGLGLAAPNPEQALAYFQEAADLGDRNAHYSLAGMYQTGQGMKQSNPSKAFRHLSMAAQSGHMQSMYDLAMMHLSGEVAPKDCQRALGLLKQIAERGRLAGGSVQAGHEAFFAGHYTQALLLYLAAGEMGVELGQSNAAWMLERGYGHAGPNAALVAMSLHRRSAEQGNVQSLLLLGDGYYFGSGVEQDWVRAASIYYEAYRERSAEAMFNLGWMHEFGAGVPKDLSLAGKFYDMAQHTFPDSALPVQIAKAWLQAHAALEWLRPRLPAPLGALLPAQMLSARPGPARAAAAGGGGRGAGGGWAAGLMPPVLAMHWESVAGRLMAWSGLGLLTSSDYWGGGGGGGGGGDAGETALLIALLIVLGVVLRVRRQRQAALEARVRLEIANGGAGGDGGGVEAQLLAERLGVAVPPLRPPLAPVVAGGDVQGAQGLAPARAASGGLERHHSGAASEAGIGGATAAGEGAGAGEQQPAGEDGGGGGGLRQRHPLARADSEGGGAAADAE